MNSNIMTKVTRNLESFFVSVNKTRYWLLIFIPLSVLLGGCHINQDYSTFSQLGFSYEYPRGWVRNIERYDNLVHARVWDPVVSENESSVGIAVGIDLNLGTNAEKKAQETVDGSIYFSEDERNFILVKKDAVILDGKTGYRAEFTYDGIANLKIQPRTYIPIRELTIAIPYNGRVYSLTIAASENEWNAHEVEIQHILNTIKLK